MRETIIIWPPLKLKSKKKTPKKLWKKKTIFLSSQRHLDPDQGEAHPPLPRPHDRVLRPRPPAPRRHRRPGDRRRRQRDPEARRRHQVRDDHAGRGARRGVWAQADVEEPQRDDQEHPQRDGVPVREGRDRESEGVGLLLLLLLFLFVWKVGKEEEEKNSLHFSHLHFPSHFLQPPQPKTQSPNTTTASPSSSPTSPASSRA